MTLKAPQLPKDLKEVQEGFQDIYGNIGFDDLKNVKAETTAPTTSTLDKGRSRIVEISGVPRLYYSNTNGVLYYLEFTAA